MFIAVGCKKKEPQSSQQSPSRAVAKSAKPSAKPTKSLQQAAADGDLEQIKLHISLGADVNAKTNKGLTPIYVAIGKGHKQAVELLIASGADVNAKTESGWMPLHSAAINDHKTIAELLIASGADVNAKMGDTAGSVPLHYAKSKDVIKLLLANGADVNAEGNYGGTRLLGAASVGDKALVEFLIANGADVNAKDKEGRMPLNAAIDKGHKDLPELLIARGADVNAKGRWDQTPLYTAIKRGYKDMVELLIANGADVNVKDGRGRTPLYVAQNPLYVPKNKEYKEIIELLRNHGAKGSRVQWSAQTGFGKLKTGIGTSNKVLLSVTRRPSIVKITPRNGIPGQKLALLIKGEDTLFVQDETKVSIDGPFVTVDSVHVESPTTIRARISIKETSSLGPMEVKVTTGGKHAYYQPGFEIDMKAGPVIDRIEILQPGWVTSINGHSRFKIEVTGARIYGRNFRPNMIDNNVYCGKRPCVVTDATLTVIDIIIPPGFTSGDLTVDVNRRVSNPLPFTAR